MKPLSKPSIWTLKVIISLLIPLLIILGSVRLLATKQYLAFEYSKADFPEDPFGYDSIQRLNIAGANLRFLNQNRPLADLAGQEQNGEPIYNERELKHMQDVQNVFQAAWRVWQIALIVVAVSGLALTVRKGARQALASAVTAGGTITTGLIVVVGLAAIIAWRAWFVFFHKVFFAAGTWTFNFTDTLIRLFPEKFWYDAALTITGLSLIAGILVSGIGIYSMKRIKQVA